MAENDEWLEAEVILASDTLLDTRYGPVRIPVESLRRLAEQMNSAQRNFAAQHDPSHVIRVRNQRAYVEQRSDGVWLLRMHGEVHRADWKEWEAFVKEAGGPGGMSMAVTEPILLAEGEPGFNLAGDAADFEDSELLELAARVPEGVPINVARLYQFAADPEPVRLVVEFVLAVIAGVAANIVASWLTDAMRLLRNKAAALGRRPAWDVRMRKDPSGAVEFEGRFWLDDDDMAVRALSRVMEMLESTAKDD